MTASDIRTIGGKKLPAVLTMVPESDPGHKTIVRYKDLVFDKPIEDRFFTEQNMRRIK